MVSTRPTDPEHFKPVPITPEEQEWLKADMLKGDIEDATEAATLKERARIIALLENQLDGSDVADPQVNDFLIKTIQLIRENSPGAAPSSTETKTPPQPYAVVCPDDDGLPGCGHVTFGEQEYARQMDRPNQTWRCPHCGREAHWDDQYFERHAGIL